MSVEALVEKIERKTADEVKAILDEGARRAAEVKSEILSAADEKVESVLRAAKDNAELIVRAGKGEDEINLRIGVLNKKRELLDDVKKEAAKKLAAMSAADYAALITRYVSESGVNGKVTVTAGDSEKARLLDKEACKAKYGFDGSFIDYWSSKFEAEFSLGEDKAEDGTVVLVCENYDIDLSFATVIDSAFEANEKALAESLFGKGASL